MKLTVFGVDIAKRVFQIHSVDLETREMFRKQIKRAAFLAQFANRSPCLIGMEACGGAQHWARRLMEVGHQVKLMPGKTVKAFVSGNKNDVADAKAIWIYVGRTSPSKVKGNLHNRHHCVISSLTRQNQNNLHELEAAD